MGRRVACIANTIAEACSFKEHGKGSQTQHSAAHSIGKTVMTLSKATIQQISHFLHLFFCDVFELPTSLWGINLDFVIHNIGYAAGTCYMNPQCFRYECVCPKGYRGDRCEVKIDYCETNPCGAGSTCVSQIGSYQCLCQPG